MHSKPDCEHQETGEGFQHRIYSVSELTREIKALLEERYPFVWVAGEISNFRMPGSGHFYFTLKDEAAQINAVMFRGQNRNLAFSIEDGMQVLGLGRISVYEPRGTYQILLEYLEPKGVGALQVAFEQLKERLAKEGLFDEKHKAPLPFLPQKIALITSPTGAVVHDMLTIILRRFPNVQIDIFPVKVQGDGAVSEIVSAILLLNRLAGADVAILARGGGSLEDLQAFNSEEVARAIYRSSIPIVSAVGHETDFTIADFVADLRAPTPSAAAELVVPLKKDLTIRCRELESALTGRFFAMMDRLRRSLDDLSRRLVHPGRKIQDQRLRIDDLTARITRWISQEVSRKRDEIYRDNNRLYYLNPISYINKHKNIVEDYGNKLLLMIDINIKSHRHWAREAAAKLQALNPYAVLHRGYSITRTIPEGTVVRDADSVHVGQKLHVLLSKGSLSIQIEKKNMKNITEKPIGGNTME